MNPSSEITEIEDIKLLVDSFYAKVKQDDLLGDIFNNVIQDNWGQHLEKMYRFWQTILLKEHTYTGAPFLPHADLPITQVHFDRWKELFYATIDEHFVGPAADEAKWRADKMAEMFLSKLMYYGGTNSKPLI